MIVSTAVSEYFGYGLQSTASKCTLTLSSFFANSTSKTEPSSLQHIDSSEDEDEGEEEQLDGNGDGIGTFSPVARVKRQQERGEVKSTLESITGPKSFINLINYPITTVGGVGLRRNGPGVPLTEL